MTQKQTKGTPVQRPRRSKNNVIKRQQRQCKQKQSKPNRNLDNAFLVYLLITLRMSFSASANNLVHI